MTEESLGIFIKQEDETGYSVIIKQEVHLSDYELKPENGKVVKMKILVLINWRTNRSIAADSDTIDSILGSTNAYTMPTSHVRAKQDPKTGEDMNFRAC